MLVFSWIVFGVMCGVAGHFYLGKARGYDLFGEIVVGICGASATGTIAPIVLGVRTGSVDILSDVGLLTAFAGAFLAVACLVWFTPRVAS
jgi:uncharacterized membrane protein YeaQ/YmgE (transglycosylase-associated protein family)